MRGRAKLMTAEVNAAVRGAFEGGVTVRFDGRDFLEAFKAFNTMADLVDLVAYI